MTPSNEEPRGETVGDPLWRAAAGVGMILVLQLVLLIGLPAGHWPRVVGIAAPLTAFVILGLALRRRLPWIALLTGLAVAIALAFAASWVVPTTSGVSRWSAQQRVAELEAVPAGDVAEFRQRGERAREAASEFDALKPRVEAALVKWASDTTAQALEEVDALRRAGQLPEAVARLERALGDIGLAEPSRGEENAKLHRQLSQKRLELARQELDALDRANKYDGEIAALARRVRQDVGNSLDKDKLDGFLRDCATSAVRGDVRPVEKMLQESDQLLKQTDGLDAAERTLQEAVHRLREIPDKHKDLLRFAKGADGMSEHADCLRRAGQVRLKAAAERRDRLKSQQKYDDIERLAEALEAEWRDGPPTLRDDVGQFVEDSIVVCVEAEVKKADALVGDKQFDAASVRLKAEREKRAAQLLREQARPEQKRPVTGSLTLARRRVAQAALDACRRRFVTLVAEERYDEVARLRADVEKKKWRDDARSSGLDDKVQAFVGGCDFVLTVARSAGKLPAVPARP